MEEKGKGMKKMKAQGKRTAVEQLRCLFGEINYRNGL
jgi:hypothetical protein